MKTLVISDLHSNIDALEAIWRQERDSDLVLCAGDMLDYGPDPREVLDWLRGHDARCVHGNHDLWIAFQRQAGRTLDQVPPEERDWAHHNAALIDDADVAWIESLPGALTVELDGEIYGLTHLYEDYQEIPDRAAFEAFRASVFSPVHTFRINRIILGHTHRQALRPVGPSLLWLNPGATSYRRLDDLEQAAQYATITDGEIALKQVVYDMRPVRQRMAQVALRPQEAAMADRFYGPRLTPAVTP